MLRQIFFLTLFFCACVTSTSHANDFSDYETDGIRDSKKKTMLDRDLWEGMKKSDAIKLIEAMPSDLASPSYYELFKTILLSDARAFEDSFNDSDQNFMDVRFNSLLRIGAFEEAEMLYDEVFSSLPKDTDMAIQSLNITLTKGQAGALCLDIQTLKSRFQEEPFWQDFQALCDHFFQDIEAEETIGEQDQDQEKTESPYEFQIFKGFKDIINDEVNAIAFDKMSVTEKLTAFAAQSIQPQEIMAYYTRNGEELPPFILKLLTRHNSDDWEEDHSCLMKEAYTRGIINRESLSIHYQGLSFPEASFKEESQTRHTLSKCEKPGWYIQWIARGKSKQDRADRTKQSFAYFTQHYPQLTDVLPLPSTRIDAEGFNPQDSFALAASYMRIQSFLPDSFADSIKERKKSKKDDTEQPLNSPLYWIMVILDTPAHFEAEDYIAWMESWQDKTNTKTGSKTKIDPAKPLSLLKSRIKLENYQQALNLCYEKFFSLTFSRNYAISSYSLTGRINAAIQNKRIGEALLLNLHVLADKHVRDAYPEDLQTAISVLFETGLSQIANSILVETLSVGK
jgi:hypothetical protein